MRSCATQMQLGTQSQKRRGLGGSSQLKTPNCNRAPNRTLGSNLLSKQKLLRFVLRFHTPFIMATTKSGYVQTPLG
uniref:Uncharacterized protein n=1 Tax=Brassica oleracea TaxID=3712 RepID=A0A3P6DGR2_BRAOL|nr:unnamed protein product [Brassica oleracea]